MEDFNLVMAFLPETLHSARAGIEEVDAGSKQGWQYNGKEGCRLNQEMTARKCATKVFDGSSIWNLKSPRMSLGDYETWKRENQGFKDFEILCSLHVYTKILNLCLIH